MTREWLVFGAASTLVIVAACVIAVAAAWALAVSRDAAVTPAWLLERGTPQPWPRGVPRGLRQALASGAAAGVVAVVGLVLVRAIAGPAEEELEQLTRYALLVWAGADAAATAAAALMLRHRHLGGGAALLAGPLACVITVSGWLAMNTVLGGDLTLDFVKDVTRAPVTLTFRSSPALARWRCSAAVRPRLPWAAPAALAASVLVTGVLVLQRDTLLPLSGSASGLKALDRSAAEARELILPAAVEYLTTTAEESAPSGRRLTTRSCRCGRPASPTRTSSHGRRGPAPAHARDARAVRTTARSTRSTSTPSGRSPPGWLRTRRSLTRSPRSQGPRQAAALERVVALQGTERRTGPRGNAVCSACSPTYRTAELQAHTIRRCGLPPARQRSIAQPVPAFDALPKASTHFAHRVAFPAVASPSPPWR